MRHHHEGGRQRPDRLPGIADPPGTPIAPIRAAPRTPYAPTRDDSGWNTDEPMPTSAAASSSIG